jgi:hypothetical protein
MREYGRHVEGMVDYLMTIEDRDQRQKNAHAIIELMEILNPTLKGVEDYQHKLWDHLFFMSDFKLDVDSPYPIPTRETYRAKPDPLPYPKQKPRYSHLGRNLEAIINKAMGESDTEKKSGFANSIAYYMKLAYNNWHKENIHDDAIRAELNAITNGQLEFTATPYVKYYKPDANELRGNTSMRASFRPQPGNRVGTGGGGGGNRTNNNNNRGNNNRGGGGGNYRSAKHNRGNSFKKRY